MPKPQESIRANKPNLLQRLGNEAHLWLVDPNTISDQKQLAGYASLLSLEESERHLRFKFEEDRHHFLISHALVRKVLSLYVDVDPASWQFSENSHGKPKIAAPQISTPLHFNLSHTEGLIACLITIGAECGMDVETVTAPHNAMGIAKKMFARTEIEELEKLDGQPFLERFIGYWTLREAYCKALGVGIAKGKNNYSFELAENTIPRIRHDATSENKDHDWQFELLKFAPNHIAAIAIQCAGSQEKKLIPEFIIP